MRVCQTPSHTRRDETIPSVARARSQTTARRDRFHVAPYRICGRKELPRRKSRTGTLSIEPWQSTVTHKHGTQSTVRTLSTRHLEIEYADAPSLLTFEASTVARANHDPLVRRFFAAKINHDVCDRRITIDLVGASPEEKVARFQVIQFEGIVPAADDGGESIRFSQPGILAGGITRWIGDAILFQHIIDKSGAIHAAVRWVGGTIFVFEVACCEIERAGK